MSGRSFSYEMFKGVNYEGSLFLSDLIGLGSIFGSCSPLVQANLWWPACRFGL